MGNQDNTPWLVKSGGRILGPYTKIQIDQFLKTREFVVLDEVAQPFNRWRYIRDEDSFSEIVEALRKQNVAAAEDDESTQTSTESGTMTAPITNFFDADDLTPRPTQEMREIVVEDIDDGSEDKPPPQKSKSQFQRADQIDDKFVDRQADEKVRNLWTVTFIILFGVLSFIFYKHFLGEPIERRLSAKESIEKGKEALILGKYNQALTEFKKANKADPNDASIYAYLGILYIQVDGQTLIGKRLLEDVYNKDQGSKYLALSGIGLAELIDGNITSAKEYFEKALQEKPDYQEAKINLGITEFLSRKYQTAKNIFENVIDSGFDEQVAHLMTVESYLYLWRSTQDRNYLFAAEKTLSSMVKNTKDYLQEALLMMAYTSYFLGKKDKALNNIYQFLDLDPDLTSDHRHNLFVYRKRVSWESLLQWCEQLARELFNNPFAKAMHAMCLSKSSRQLESKSMINDALNQSPKDGLLQAIYSYVLQSSGQTEEASVALGRSLDYAKTSNYVLPNILQAKFCERTGDFNCSLDNWKKVIESRPNSLSATAGIARSHLNLKNFSESQRFLFNGFKESKSYKPLLEVKKYAEKEGILPSNTN